jgi:hypothetical protein
MSWAKLCGSFCFHRKVLEADLMTKHRASGAFARMISWSAENMTGGKLSAAIALTIAKDQKIIDALVAVVMLEREGNDYTIHDFGDYNPTGEELAVRRDQLRLKRSEAGRRGAAARWGHGKPDGNLPSTQMANGGNGCGKKMPPSPSPSPSLSPPPTVVDFALTRVDATAKTAPAKNPNARTAKHTPEEVAAKNRVVQTFIDCFKAKKQVEPKAILDVDHAKAFELAKWFGVEEACGIVRRAFENDFVVHENATLRYIASKADTFRGAAPKKAHGRHEPQRAVGDEPWLREHLT